MSTKQLLAQALTYQDGSPAKEIKLVNVEGSELLYPNWRLGSAKIASGIVYSNISLKYNLYEDQLYFLGKDSISMKFISPVNEFHLEKDVFKNGYPPVKTFNNLSYYLVMVEGKATLLKKLIKSIIDVKDFNSSITTKRIMDDKSYFLFINGVINQVKNDKSSFLNLFKDKSSEMESFFRANKTNFKKDEDLINAISYYNTLK
ncbi:hypothetical protein GCM10008119_35130 [Pedobacter mendelii]|uniref:Uncharacterized protein n=2 Tax=Pedobacter mendelii TaxID=1908240 RepID=A0ABQ2BNL0_9SPHI|nr:hypothetical protein GCM10008119_35130 [Pedobacter mendelii]